MQLGIAISVACSLFTLILSSMRPPYAMLGRLPGTHVFVDLRRHPEARRVPGVVLFGYSAALHFANKDHFRESLHKLIARRDVDGSSGAFAPSASASAPSPGGGHGQQGGAEDLTSQQILFEEPADIRTSADLAPATPLLETPNTPAAKLAASRARRSWRRRSRRCLQRHRRRRRPPAHRVQRTRERRSTARIKCTRSTRRRRGR